MNPCGVPLTRMIIPGQTIIPGQAIIPGQTIISGQPIIPGQTSIIDLEPLYNLINELTYTRTRRNALYELSKRRGSIPDLAPMLWYSFGTITSLLKEIITAYPAIFPPTLTAAQSSIVCNALALLQCVASHHETRSHFLAANIPMFLYPFLNASSTSRPFEYLRLTSLGVIGALVKCDDKEVINYLLQSEMIPLCLRIMENNSDLSKTVATFIMQKILLDDNGLLYTCETYERFSHVARTLGKMVLNITKELPNQNQGASNLLKHIIRCFLRLSENPRAREALRQCIPEPLINGTFFCYLGEKDQSRGWLCQLAKVLEPVPPTVLHGDERSYGI